MPRRALFLLALCFFLSGLGSLVARGRLDAPAAARLRLDDARREHDPGRLHAGPRHRRPARRTDRAPPPRRRARLRLDRDRDRRSTRSRCRWLFACVPGAEPRAARTAWASGPRRCCASRSRSRCCCVPTILMGATLPILVAALVRDEPRVGAQHRAALRPQHARCGGGRVRRDLRPVPAARAVGHEPVRRAARRRGRRARAAARARRGRRRSARRGGRAGATRSRTRRACAAERATPAPLRVLLVAYALVGFTALVYEVAWTRALAIVLGSSIYAFSAMLGRVPDRHRARQPADPRAASTRPRRPLVLLRGRRRRARRCSRSRPRSLLPRLPDVVPRRSSSATASTRRADRAAAGRRSACSPCCRRRSSSARSSRCSTRLVADSTRATRAARSDASTSPTRSAPRPAPSRGLRADPAARPARHRWRSRAAIDLAAPRRVLLRARAGRAACARARCAASPALRRCCCSCSRSPFDRDALTRGVFRGPELVLDFGVDVPAARGRADGGACSTTATASTRRCRCTASGGMRRAARQRQDRRVDRRRHVDAGAARRSCRCCSARRRRRCW